MPLSSSREGRKEGKKKRRKRRQPSKATAIQNQISHYKQPTLTTTTTTTTTTMPKNDAFRSRTGTLQATQIASW
jgi:hypothetical protein